MSPTNCPARVIQVINQSEGTFLVEVYGRGLNNNWTGRITAVSPKVKYEGQDPDEVVMQQWVILNILRFIDDHGVVREEAYFV